MEGLGGGGGGHQHGNSTGGGGVIMTNTTNTVITIYQPGDLVWFNALASTTALAAAAAAAAASNASGVGGNNNSSSQPSSHQSGSEDATPGDALLIPGEVVEYMPKGNVLILRSSTATTLGPTGGGHLDDSSQHLYTIENSPQNVRRRVGELSRGPGYVGFPDMISMNDLSEPALLWNIKERYAAGEIYTYVGSIMISVNPYKMFDIYGLPVVKKYEGKVLGALPPHLFAISSSAYTRMAKDASPQVIIISGESGSGKTEATKLIMGYLALVNKSPSNLITEQILEANPLLESFGNAKTGKNDNSSRFGKYLQVYFNTSQSSSSLSSGSGHQAGSPGKPHHRQSNSSAALLTPIITGCRITEYLLEKSRIVTHNEQERNYHVFYELLRGLSKEQKEKYGLLSAEKYFYLNQGGNCAIPGKNDADDFQALLSAMQILGFNNDEINNIFKILAAVLHLGNVYFHRKNLKHGVEGVEIGSDVEVQWIGHLLELSPEGIRKALTSRVTEARGEKVTTPLTIDQSLDARDAIAKVLYSSLFSWLVNRINRIVYKGDGDGICINILDIFGFEDFKENSFEQLLINFANESLQHIMNKHIFKLEQQEYVKEKIDWTLIAFEDNLPVINLLTKKPVGILHLLDDESNFPKGTDASFLEKCHYNHALNEHYLRPRMNSNEFGVKHYAGSVLYNVEGFLEKNRDMVRSDVIRLLGSSRCGMIAKMFAHLSREVANPNVYHYHGPKSPGKAGGRGGGGGDHHGHGHHHPPPHHHQQQQQHHGHGGGGGNARFITMKPRAPTVAARFHDNLSHLLESMSKCSPWFVRCVKPNATKTPMKFDVRTVSNQLRFNGILETTRIRKLGYPIRSTFPKFADRYKCLVRNNYSISPRDLTRMILTTHTTDDYQLGSTKVFLREVLEQKLENARYELTHAAAVTIQSAVRGYLARKSYRELIASIVKIQGFWRMYAARVRFLKVRKGVIKLQALIRMKREKARYNALVKRMTRNRDLCVTGVNHLEIPAELAFMMSKMDPEEQPIELAKIGKSRELAFARDASTVAALRNLDAFSFDKYVRVFFKSNFGMRREPIITPFLKESPEGEALTIFKLILRFMNDPNLSGKREVLLMNYIVNKGMSNPLLRDEILVQILNQTKNNENKLNCDRGWVLLASCLSAFQPSDNLYSYVLNYAFNEHAYSSVLQAKLLQMGRVRGAGRCVPPFGLEYRGIKNRAQMYVEVEGIEARVESWTTVEEVAGEVAAGHGFGGSNGDGGGGLPGGFSLEIEDREVGSYSFVFDHLNEPHSRAYPFKFTVPELFGGRVALGASAAHGNGSGYARNGVQARILANNNSRTPVTPKSRSMESLLSSGQSPNHHGNSSNQFRRLGLSSSRLNERYHSIDNLDDGGNGSGHAMMMRKHQQHQKQQQMSNSSSIGNSNVSRKLSTDYFDLDEEEVALSCGDEDDDVEEEIGIGVGEDDEDDDDDMDDIDMAEVESSVKVSVSNSKNSRIGNPRFIKSTAGGGLGGLGGGKGGGSSLGPGSINAMRSAGSSVYGGGSSRMYIERGGGGGSTTTEQVYGMIKSSALSDTSEAPSLASHVRRVRVPSQASDVDQFLDDLFSPVLENLDDLSDARSLITSIKGGNPDNLSNSQSPVPENTTTFLQSAFAQNLQIQQQLIAQNQALQQLLQQTLGVDPPVKASTSPTSDQQQQQQHHHNNNRPDRLPLGNNVMMMMSDRGGMRPPPPPPPLPPSPLQGHRPFIDPYGRAKTVRIGKWRWPPKHDEMMMMDGSVAMALSNNGLAPTSADDFAAFKARVEEARRLDNDIINTAEKSSSNGGDSFVWPEDGDDDSNKSSCSSSDNHHQNKLIGLVGGKKIARPFGGDVVGKLKLSNEMRMKLEQVTSVRLGKGSSAPKIPMVGGGSSGSSSDQIDDRKNNKPVRKLDDSRRNVLEQKLGGIIVGREHHAGGDITTGRANAPTAPDDFRGIGGVPPPPPPMMPPRNSNMASSSMQHEHEVSQFMRSSRGGGGDSMDRVDHRSLQHGRRTNNNSKTTPPTDYYYSSFEHSSVFLSSFKLKNGPRFRLRKEVFMPGEEVGPKFGEFLKAQVVRDLRVGSPRILERERSAGVAAFLRGAGEGGNNVSGGGAVVGWKEVVEVAKTWELYFWRLYRVQTSRDVAYLAVSSKGIKLVSVVAAVTGGNNNNANNTNNNQLNVVEFYSWSNITSVSVPKASIFSLQTHSSSSGQPHHQQNFFTAQADQIRRLCLLFYNSSIDYNNKRAAGGGSSSGGHHHHHYQGNGAAVIGNNGSSSVKRGVITAGGKQIDDVLIVSNNRFIKQQEAGGRGSGGESSPGQQQQQQQLVGHHHSQQQQHQQRFFGGQSSQQLNNGMSSSQQYPPHHHHHHNQQHHPLPPPPPPPPPPPQTSPHHHQHQNSNSPSPTNGGVYGQSSNHHYRSTSLSSPPPGQQQQQQPNSMMIDPYKAHHHQQQQQQRHHSLDTSINSDGIIPQQPPQQQQLSSYHDDGKHSLLQFAMKYFRQDKFNLASALHGGEDNHHNQKGKSSSGSTQQSAWTWRDQIGLVKYSPKMIECSLLPMDEEMNRVAMECYVSLLKYIGDWGRNFAGQEDGGGKGGKGGGGGGPPHMMPSSVSPGQLERNSALADVEAVYTLLRNCHNSPVILRDEVYCQVMKQTTNNATKSAQRAWRLFTILAAYFTCSEVLRPYLFKYLETNAYDKRRAFHGTALVCLQNLRKTFKYGGRRNVPSVEEITAITAGRNAKRQIFRLPGGTQRVVNIKATTVVQDVIDELCGMLNISEPPEAEEFSVYCIVEGDTFTMPLQKEEYILDVTTELNKNQQTFYLIFCRSVWYYPMRLDSALYIEVVFNQIAPDYLEGLLLTMPGQCLTQNQVYDISKIAALLHRAADLSSPPSLKETKYLLPKPALAARDMRPNQWVSLVNNYWNEEGMAQESFTPMSAKASVLEILAAWDLFGSSFFSVKRLADPAPPEEYIMALNKNGVHFLDIITHETLNWWSYSEIISTRKVKNEDSILYLDMKTGNLMQTRITRFQTEHAHEISRLIRQYIQIQKYSKNTESNGEGGGGGEMNVDERNSNNNTSNQQLMALQQQQALVHHHGNNNSGGSGGGGAGGEHDQFQ